MRGVVFAIVLAGAADARADVVDNWLVGPVLGIHVGDPRSSLLIGFEGGIGHGAERFNLGFEHRADKELYYAELDPWFVVGGSFGVGVDSDRTLQPIIGLWEGVPIAPWSGACDAWHSAVTVAVGYRYTGVHEIYLTVKAGQAMGQLCWDSD
jgi:hypothetical protein